MNKTLKDDAYNIVTRAIAAVDPATSVHRALKRKNNLLTVRDSAYDLKSYSNIYLISFGKAAAAMAKALENILGNTISDGIVLTKYGHAGSKPDSFALFEAGHPLPDENSLLAANSIKEMLEKANEKDLVFFLISGGGSALLTFPRDNINLSDLVDVTEQLLKAGATIGEMNTIRKHISDVKGGGLARLAYPAESISLILSDVVGDPLDVIASGPTVPDNSSFKDCEEIVRKYDLDLSKSVRDILEAGFPVLLKIPRNQMIPYLRSVIII